MERKDWLSLNGIWGFEKALPRTRRRWGRTSAAGSSSLPHRVGAVRRDGADRALGTGAPSSALGLGGRRAPHFGAVDREASVRVNARTGKHRGGYDRSSFDITEALKPQGLQELVVGSSTRAMAEPAARNR
jgi:hypothetical protein